MASFFIFFIYFIHLPDGRSRARAGAREQFKPGLLIVSFCRGRNVKFRLLAFSFSLSRDGGNLSHFLAHLNGNKRHHTAR